MDSHLHGYILRTFPLAVPIFHTGSVSAFHFWQLADWLILEPTRLLISIHTLPQSCLGRRTSSQLVPEAKLAVHQTNRPTPEWALARHWLAESEARAGCEPCGAP